MSAGGRPSDYTPELGNQICQEMIEGKSLARVCRELGINYRSVFNWLKDPDKDEFLQQYMHAREERADYLADDILDIADDNTLQADDRRIRIDARKWYAGKLKPKAYGDKQDLTITGKLETTPDDKLESRIAELIGKAGIVKQSDGATEAQE